MREIKFRAWDKGRGKMVPWMRGIPGGGVRDWPMKAFEHDDIIIEQFTGLKNKDGVDIYEGDILEWEDRRGVVIFENGAFTANLTYIEVEHSFWGEAKILGNVHQHPDLLK